MLVDQKTENEIIYELCRLLGRAILPVAQYERPGEAGPGLGTAFFYSELVGATDDGEVVHEWLLTADASTRAPYGEIGLRPSLTEPAEAASASIPLPDFAAHWLHLPQVGSAAMPTGGLHGYAEDEGWCWRSQQVTDAVAARADMVARVGAEPGSVFVLAFGVVDDGSRHLEVVIEQVVRDGDELRIIRVLPTGYVGAPVFDVQAHPDGAVVPHCLGLVLPAEGDGHRVATFDRIRSALAEATAGFR